MKILVVDDEAGIRALCQEMLCSAGFDVQTAVSGEEALPLLHEGWDLVLTDISMPGVVDGNELVRRVQVFDGTDILLMTGRPTLDTAIQAMKDGAADYLIKPFTANMLLLAVQRCIERRRLSQELSREKSLRAELDRAYTDLSQMEQVRKIFGQFVTPEVAEFALAHPQDFLQHGERKTVTVLFADVRRFTPFSARVPPEEAVSALNQIFDLVIDAIQREGGILNKFIGDGLMGLFGAPVPNEDHARAAARVALQARAAVEALSETRRTRGLDSLRIGIGINTGEVVAGCLGTKNRAEYSVIGHAVNVAARLEELSAMGQILVGPETSQLIYERFDLRAMAAVNLAGVLEPVPVSELIGERGARSVARDCGTFLLRVATSVRGIPTEQNRYKPIR